jgi:hypothetical protein
MKKSELRQLIKEEFIKILNERDIIDEGWKENILVGLASLAGSLGLGLKAQDTAQNMPSKEKTETSYSTKESYQVLIGYLIELDQAGVSNKTPEELGAITEARMYLEALRDNKTPNSLSNPAKVVLDYAIKETKNLNGFELKRLSDLGENVKTTSYNE